MYVTCKAYQVLVSGRLLGQREWTMHSSTVCAEHPPFHMLLLPEIATPVDSRGCPLFRDLHCSMLEGFG